MWKNGLLCLFICLLVSCKARHAAPRSMVKPLSEIDASQKNRAYDVGLRVLSACNSSRFQPFRSDEATDQLRQNLTAERLTRTCQKYRAKYGTFKGLRLVEVIEYPKTGLLVYRYKASYQKNQTIKELRVTMDGTRATALETRNWTDDFTP